MSGLDSGENPLAAAHAHCAHGRWEDAITEFQKDLVRRPEALEAWIGVALCHEELGNVADAITALKCCLAQHPETALAFHRLGWLSYREKKLIGALKHYLKAIQCVPTWYEPSHHAAVCCHELRRYPEALAHYEHALTCNDNLAIVWYHTAKVLKDGGQLAAALPVYRRALALQPDFVDARYSLGLLHLLRGEWLEGWKGYELRWQGSDRAGVEQLPATDLRRWFGEDVPEGSGLVVYAEQGMGDSIMCFRFAELLSGRFARVKFAETLPLVTLFQYNAPAGVEVVPRIRQAINETGYTHYIHSLSLPAAMRLTPENVPGEPYLRAPLERRMFWQQRLDSDHRPKVGVVWRGGKLTHAPARDAGYSCLAPLLKIDRICWVSLQMDELHVPANETANWMDQVKDFADTAALIANLDLVIAVDTAVAHLAGAMGKPVWLLNRFESEWRWMRDRNTTPWYPSMRIFSQSKPGDWDGVISQVLAEYNSSGVPFGPSP